ncbi:MAG: hypothetical protein ACTSV3_01540 [Candidatus Thorarchaeota archaeon]|nr:MAG: hypothetical protein DRO87_10895 [Candidatus Thorarchaeota archaeon]RLI55539.1 MAG: hypothetical protein DRP09_09505 [Candidatus Thorarchaeota archaeon]
MSKNEIRPPINLKIASMEDLARMLVSWSQRDRPASMLYFEHNGKHIYGTLISNHGYYEYYGMPLWVHIEGDGPPEGNFLAYKSRPKESVVFVDSLADSEPMTVFLPIIRLSEKLELLDMP